MGNRKTSVPGARLWLARLEIVGFADVIGHDDNDIRLIGQERQGQEARNEEQDSFHFFLLG